MLVTELISKKQSGGVLTNAGIDELVSEFAVGRVPDYQMAALLMAIYFRGLDDREGLRFLDAMIRSGERLSFDSIPRRKVDKHSTGGIGDKTSLIIAPVVAEAGVPIPMISGRALGHTGGTLDKLESIRGLRVTLTHEEFARTLTKHYCAFGAQTESLVPADKRLYALRDVTSTVAIPPLIAASILSKKIAEGTNALVMDVKIGPGGFLTNEFEARELSARLVRWSAEYSVETIAVGTDMCEPLGRTAGNRIEVAECLDILATGDGDARLIELCAVLGGTMLKLGGVCSSTDDGKNEFLRILQSGTALARFQSIAEEQGADPSVWREFESGERAANAQEILAQDDGFLQEIRPRDIGLGLVDLGAGRCIATDEIDPTAGIEFFKRRGNRVTRGEPLARAYWSRSTTSVQTGLNRLAGAFVIGSAPAETRPLVYFETK
ncbi:MAG: thymidine phosphorylase [bacterium]|nr:thymidine phosphorylase [bacterium]